MKQYDNVAQAFSPYMFAYIFIYIHTWSANIRLYYEPNKNHYLPHLAQLCHTPGAPLNWRPGDAHWTVQEPEPVAGVPKFKGIERFWSIGWVFTWFSHGSYRSF